MKNLAQTADRLVKRPHKWPRLMNRVCAKHRIYDCPSSRFDDTVERGTIGFVQDEIEADGLLVVEFDGERILLISVDEVRAA
jgi:hypothetical protein